MASQTEITRRFVTNLFTNPDIPSPGKAILECLDENAKWTVTGSSRFAGEYHGKEEYHSEVLSKILVKTQPGMTAKLCKVMADEYWATAYFFTENSYGVDGYDFNMDYCWLLKVVDQKVVEVIAFPDSNKLVGLFNSSNRTVVEEPE